MNHFDRSGDRKESPRGVMSIQDIVDLKTRFPQADRYFLVSRVAVYMAIEGANADAPNDLRPEHHTPIKPEDLATIRHMALEGNWKIDMATRAIWLNQHLMDALDLPGGQWLPEAALPEEYAEALDKIEEGLPEPVPDIGGHSG